MYSAKKARRHCVHGELVSRRFLQPWQNFALQQAGRPSFGFSFLTALTHDNEQALQLLDEDIVNGLERLLKAGVLDNTVLIVMGDHGQRIVSGTRRGARAVQTKIQHTFTGRIEERMPLFAVSFPRLFRERHPEKLEQFIRNKVGEEE